MKLTRRAFGTFLAALGVGGKAAASALAEPEALKNTRDPNWNVDDELRKAGVPTFKGIPVDHSDGIDSQPRYYLTPPHSECLMWNMSGVRIEIGAPVVMISSRSVVRPDQQPGDHIFGWALSASEGGQRITGEAPMNDTERDAWVAMVLRVMETTKGCPQPGLDIQAVREYAGPWIDQYIREEYLR